MSTSKVPTLTLAELEAVTETPATAARAYRTLDQACRDHGFFLLTGHGCDATFQAMWQASAAFFGSDQAIKRSVFRTADRPLGYYDRELTKRQRDLKEVFDYTAQPPAGKRDRNQWPEQPAGFREAMTAFYDVTGELAMTLMGHLGRTLAFGRALENGASAEEALAAKPLELPQGSPANSNVRLNYYPTADPLSAEEQVGINALGAMALHHHTDPGLITLLLQDAVGGLQTETRCGEWIDVPANPDAIVVNLGDSLQVVSNDRYRAAVHRVLPMQGQARYSTPYFLNPRRDAVLEPLAALNDLAPRYQPIPWKSYIQARIDDNFEDLGADDTQISHYRTTAA